MVHCVLLCSLLTTWLGKPVDVVASLGTHMALVFVYRMMEHRANQTSAAIELNIERNALLGKFKAKFKKFKR